MVELYLAISMEELDRLTIVPNLKGKPALSIAKSAATVLATADSEYKQRDEEKAYIFYMKFFQLVAMVRETKDYEKNKLKIRSFLGTNESLTENMNRLTELKSSLIKRYEAIAPKQEPQLKKSKEENKENVSQKTSNNDQINETFSSGQSRYINCTEVYNIMRNQCDDLLLLDCRRREHFEESSIVFKHIINIPSENINGLSASKLEGRIDERSKILWKRRDQFELIVLIDWDETKKNTNTSKPIWVLRSILLDWDPDTQYKSSPRLLDGGYENFLLMYPHSTTNPRFRIDSSMASRNITLSDIEYPSWNEIKMKDKSLDGTIISPRVDRSNKALAERRFNDLKKPTEELFKEQEFKIDQVLQKEQEVLNIGNELNNVLNATETTNDPNKKKEWFNKQTEIEYRLVQKENELNDTVMELESVEQPGFENKLESLQIDANKQQDVSQIIARIEAKQAERLEMERRRREHQQILEEKRRPVREQQKRHLEIEEEEQIRPKQPTIDRSVKPTATVQRPQIQRDFSPVHGTYGDIGATGLKNLGNTCYMNSIIQCLVNIEYLSECLRKGVYQRYLNVQSKTQGRITEELAAVCKELWSGRYKSISPRNLRYVIGQYQKMFSGYDQQDSHEFLTILIDMLHSELQISMDKDPDEELSAPEKAWREFVNNKQSIIQALFFGQIRSTLKCRDCGEESPTYEGFSNLSLELPNDNQQCEIYDCLDLYFNGEYIDGWTCPRCKESREAIKKLDISKLPQILVIHLKRFHVNLNSSLTTYQKKQNYVRFPPKNFDIRDYITNSVKDRRESFTYDLCAVSNHYGTMERGHYTAFCKNYKSNNWYKFDDNYVTQIPNNEVNSSAAYILFYQRK